VISIISNKTNRKFKKFVAGLLNKHPLNKNILLIQAPQFLHANFNPDIVKNGGAYAYPPVGLQFIKNSLAGRDLSIDILDLNFEILKRTIDDPEFQLQDWTGILRDRMEKSGATVFGVTCTCVPGHPADADFFFTDIMREIADLDCGIVIVGGSIAAKHKEFFLSEGLCHFVVSGEGEQKARWLFDHLYPQQQSHPPQSGIYFRDGDAITETDGEAGNELSSTVLETYADIPLEEYWRVGCLNPFSKMAGIGTAYGTVQLNRGCRANCKFCGVFEFMGKGVRQREPKNVIDEIRYLVTERGVRHVDILDDDFLGITRQRQGLIELLKAMGELHKRYAITWAASNGLVAASLDEEILDLINHSGCNGFRMGIESGNDQMVRHLRRPSSLASVRKAAEMLQGYPDIFVSGNYIIGFFATETFGKIMDTYRLIYELNLDWAGISAFQFTSKLDPENQTEDRASTHDFVPTRDHWLRVIEGGGKIVTGPAVFNLDLEGVPDPDQIKEIWFAFNLLANYVNNKNLRPGGRHDKFVSWVDALYVSYPGNAYMPLFSALGCTLMGNQAGAGQRLRMARENLEKSDYWTWRFGEFGLTELINDFPETPEDTHERLEGIRLAP